MYKPKETVEEYLERKLRDIVLDRKISSQYYAECMDKYNIPGGLVADYAMGNKALGEANPFILFCLIDCIPENMRKKGYIESAFTKSEIEMYSNSKYDQDKQIFPLVFRVHQVRDDQWIGRIDLKTLMDMRDAQIINYNTDTQRTLKRVVRGEEINYQISVNKKTVKDISDSVADGTYIPTPLTLNVLPETKIDFNYDDKTGTLIIFSVDKLDMTDGYHRYLALSKDYDLGLIDDFTMELRLTIFSKEKASHFIFQEDQKTKMKKVDSDSFNMSNPANIVTQKINESPKCNLQGLINRATGVINAAWLSEMIKFFCFRSVPKSQQRIKIIQVTNELIEFFNIITESNVEYLEEPYSYKKLLAVMCVFSHYRDKDKSDMPLVLNKVIPLVVNNDSKKLNTGKISKPIVKEVEKMIEEVKKRV